MRSFHIVSDTPQHFASRVNETLRMRKISHYVSCTLEENNVLAVVFQYMGRSVLRFCLTPCAEGGYIAELASERMSPFHTAFRAEFESRFEGVLNELGAKLMESRQES